MDSSKDAHPLGEHAETVLPDAEVDAGLQLSETERDMTLWQAATVHWRILYYGNH